MAFLLSIVSLLILAMPICDGFVTGATSACTFRSVDREQPIFYLKNFSYPIMTENEYAMLPPHCLQKIYFAGHPYVIYKPNKICVSPLIMFSDICPHQGASLSRGTLTPSGNLQCSYHGFIFKRDDGTVKIPSAVSSIEKEETFTSSCVPRMETTLFNGFLFVKDTNSPVFSPYFPPEEHDPAFRSVSGVIRLKQNHMVVCENVLDMLHVSYVHSFGNKKNPLPRNVRFRFSPDQDFGVASFSYIPPPNSLAPFLGASKKIHVENEYHLPSTTVTRVRAAENTKTVWTSATPLENGDTLLFYRIYRDFFVFPGWDILNQLGDWFIAYLMRQTVNEDARVLKYVYSRGAMGLFRLSFDKLLRTYDSVVRDLFEKQSNNDTS